MSGVASIAIKLEETCPPPYQDIEDKIDILDTKINEVLANQEDCGAPGGGEGGEGDWCGHGGHLLLTAAASLPSSVP